MPGRDKTMTTNQLIELLWKHVFSWCGAPLRIIGDRDTRLTSSRMKALVKGLGAKLALSAGYHPAKLALSAGYHPQTDGSTERFNRTFLTMLRICCRKSPRTWDVEIPSLLYAYHNTFHTSTGYTPRYCLDGYPLIFECLWHFKLLQSIPTLMPTSIRELLSLQMHTMLSSVLVKL